MHEFKISDLNLKTISVTSGVYIFRNNKKFPIYIGKAKNLKNRLQSYFSIDLLPKTKLMIKNAKYLSIIEVNNEFDALLLEARLVKDYQPQFNIELKDDKSPLYIVITKEKYPRILSLRRPQLKLFQIKYVFGPFNGPLGANSLLRTLRKIIPFSQHLPKAKVCVLKQISLCDPCPSEFLNMKDKKLKIILERKYKENIRNIKNILNGKIDKLISLLEKKMQIYANQEMFEDAQSIKDLLTKLNYLRTPIREADEYLTNPNLITDIRKQESEALFLLLQPYMYNLQPLSRIECYDISHFQGSSPTASMVTFIKAEADKNYYRHFKVDKSLRDDSARMKSILQRRLKHLANWGKPDLIVVDGGKPQVSAALKAVGNLIPIIGLAKRLETIVIKTNEGFREIKTEGPALYLLERLRNESHRFAQRLHHKIISYNYKI